VSDCNPTTTGNTLKV